MDQTMLLYVIAAFTLVSAIALCVQAGFLFGMYKASKAMQEKAAPLIPKIEALVDTSRITLDTKLLPMLPKIDSIIDTAKSTVEESKKHIVDITAKANDLMDSTKLQMGKVDGVMTDAATRAKSQLERAEMVLDDTIGRAHETVAVVHNGIMRPLREMNGLAMGLRAALGHLQNRRPSVDRVTSDEEMFI